jgi:hypothetical protein
MPNLSQHFARRGSITESEAVAMGDMKVRVSGAERSWQNLETKDGNLERKIS